MKYAFLCNIEIEVILLKHLKKISYSRLQTKISLLYSKVNHFIILIKK